MTAESPTEAAAEAGGADDATPKKSPLYFAFLRDLFAAPEYERFLAQRGVDLMVVDQIQALRIRVERGLAVLDDRIAATDAAAARAQRNNKLVLGLCVLAAIAGAALTEGIARAAIVSVGAAMSVSFFRRGLLLGADRATLQGLANTQREAVKTTEDKKELLELSKAIYAEVEAVAGGFEVDEEASASKE
ncbi:MAG: hypothetical protein AAF488_07645 [Planctomycetota bacterium]